MPSVAVNPPKTPVTKGSKGIAAATIPNVCKMPPPPPPFVPTPLPNIGKSEKSPKDYSTSVKIEGHKVAIRGASFGSTGDMASKASGGGILSSNVEGPTKFLAPGSRNVQIEGKNVQFLGDQMLNNCGPSGSPANAATMEGETQGTLPAEGVWEMGIDCDEKRKDPRWSEDPCKFEELCAMVKAYNESPHPKKSVNPSPSNPSKKFPWMDDAQKALQDAAHSKYQKYIRLFKNSFTQLVAETSKDDPRVVKQFHAECRHKKWSDAGGKTPMPGRGPGAMNPDHAHPVGRGGPISGPHLWADALVNCTVGPSMDEHNPETHPKGIKAKDNCNCAA